MNQAATDATATLNGTVGDVFLGTADINTGFDGKLISAAFS